MPLQSGLPQAEIAKDLEAQTEIYKIHKPPSLSIDQTTLDKEKRNC